MDTGHGVKQRRKRELVEWNLLGVRLGTVCAWMLPCHESPGHYNDQPSWGHTQHSSLSPRLLRFGLYSAGAATHFTDVEFLYLY